MTDDVNGIVIGPVTTDMYITFHDRNTGDWVCGGNWYKDEHTAVRWFKEHYPSKFKEGVEMRIHGEGK